MPDKQPFDPAQPYWLQLSMVFRYPLQPEPRLRWLAMGGVGLLVAFGYAFSPLIIVPLVGLFIGVAVLFRYAYWTMLEAAEGDLLYGRHGLFAGGSGLGEDIPYSLLFKQIIAFTLFGLSVGLAECMAESLGHIAVWVTSLAVPANVMLLGTRRSLRASLNPLAILRLMHALGWPYLTLFGLSWVFLESLMLLLSWLNALPGWLAWPLIFAVSAYWVIALMLLFGAAMYQSAATLGYQPRYVRRQEELRERPEKSGDPLHAARVYVERGMLDRALLFAQQALRKQPNDLEAHRLYDRLLIELRQLRERPVHAESFVPLLLNARAFREASRVMNDVKDDRARRALYPERMDDAVLLASGARQEGFPELAVDILETTIQKDGNNVLRPNAELLLAEILWHPLRRGDEAIARLQQLISHFPKSRATTQAEVTLTTWSASRAS